MRIAWLVRVLVLGLMGASSPLCAAPSPELGPVHPTRQQLIGVWRLVRIEMWDTKGPLVDPFYQADSAGIIVYDPSGWMSVQISAPHRPAVAVPESRSSPPATGPETLLKAAAFDTYYSYYGTWDLDEATGVVTHHVKSSLIPAEAGLSYAQKVSLEDGRLIFTSSRGKDAKETLSGKEAQSRKMWERIPGFE